MTDYTIPRANAPIAGQDVPTIQWYNYLHFVGQAASTSNAALLNDITIISDKLGSPDGTPENIPSLGNITDIQPGGSISITGANIKLISLINDQSTPGDTRYYGTNVSGMKGWYTIYSAFTSSPNIVPSVSGTGITSFDLTDVTLTTGGNLSKWAFDSKGRASETDSATTSDLTEGSNLYFTSARVLSTVLASLSTATSAVITAADSVLSAFGKLQAQITDLTSSLSGYARTNYTVLPSNITVTASPFSYQNTSGYDADVLVDLGTVTSISFSRDNVTYYATGLATGSIHLSPSDWVKVIYTIAPTMTLIPR